MMMKNTAAVVLFSLITGTVFGQPPAPAPSAAKPVNTLKLDTPELAAEVNGEKIFRHQLAAECLSLYGESELQELINTNLIRMECDRLKITVTAEEIDSEVIRMAQTFKMSSDQWLKLLEKERQIQPEQYRQDIVWRMLALAKLAGPRVQISPQELQQAYDAQFGQAVQVRQIVLNSRAEAESLLTALKKNPESFPSAAKNKSLDPVSQPYGGMIQPVRHHTLNPQIEKILFGLKPGEISPVVEWPAGQFIIFRCEKYIEPQQVDFQAVQEQLRLKLRDTKLRQVADDVFTELQKKTKVQIVLANPALMTQYPGVAAFLNGQAVLQKDLADVCLQKHGKTVLNDMISRLIVEQACRQEKITITEADIDNEIRESAIKFLPLKADGSADTELWIKRAVEESGLPPAIYRKQTVAPMLALKRLTKKAVIVTEEDIQRSFEANYGQKVRCLAIILRDQRRAQEVWAMANRHKTAENFGDLAEKYSIDQDTRLGRGVIPPFAKYCGQPELEKEAFSLKPGDLSQIVQTDDHLVILFCIGYVEPVKVNIAEVKADLIADIFEKKQQLVIHRYFERLYEQAVFSNYLTGVSQKPAAPPAADKTAAF